MLVASQAILMQLNAVVVWGTSPMLLICGFKDILIITYDFHEGLPHIDHH